MSPWWESLVQIRTPGGRTGSGVLVSPNQVLTAAHVVAPNGTRIAPGEIVVDVRYRQRVIGVEAVALPGTWGTSASIGSDLALLSVSPIADLGLCILPDYPASDVSATLEGFGFDAHSNALVASRGHVTCKLAPDGGHYLYTDDFTPVPGMSGGPLCAGRGGEVRVVGVVTHQSQTGLIGLSILATALAGLRAQSTA